MPRRPGDLKIKAACIRIHVQHLTGGIKPGTSAAFQSFRIKLAGVQAAGGDLGVFQSLVASHRQAEILDVFGDGGQVCLWIARRFAF